MMGTSQVLGFTTLPPTSIAESHQDAIERLPQAYQQYGVNLKTVIKDTEAGFEISIPWRVSDGVAIDKVLQTESGHVKGYSFNLSNNDGQESYVFAITKRDNEPTNGKSQTQWNTTWYDVPLKNMSDKEYLDIWKQNESSLFDENIVEGGLIS